MMPPLLSAANVTVTRAGRAIVDRVTVAVSAGEFVALMGPNGAGKTTLLRALASLISAEGDIRLAGQPAHGMQPIVRARTLAFLPQGHAFAWPMPVAEVVALGRQPHAGRFGRLTAKDRQAIARAMAATDVTEFADRAVTTLSGGERARVAIARALATEAPLLLTDEPIASLDPRHQLNVMALLRDVARRGHAVIAALHDLTLAARYCDRAVLLDRGALVADAPPEEALSAARARAVFGIDTISVEADGARIIVVKPPG